MANVTASAYSLQFESLYIDEIQLEFLTLYVPDFESEEAQEASHDLWNVWLGQPMLTPSKCE